MHKLSNALPCLALLTIKRSFVGPHLDYGDVIYDQPGNDAFSYKIVTFQYNASLVMTGATRGTSKN